jgi:hypothetical protein
MADQASVRGAGYTGPSYGSPGRGVNGRGGAQGGGNGLVSGLAEFGHDVATLAELQAKLTAHDLKESGERVAVPLALVATAAALALGGLFVALLGVADLLVLVLKVSAGTAKLITAAFTLAVAGLIVFGSSRALLSSLEPLRRSRDELARNVAWVRTVLLYSGRSNPRRGA